MGVKVVPLPSAVDESLIDARVIEELRDCVGDAVCRELLIDALLETTDRLAQLEAALRSADREQIRRLAHDLVSLPGQVGMTRLSGVSQDLADCAAKDEWPTVCAVADRLLRVGQETLAIYPAPAR